MATKKAAKKRSGPATPKKADGPATRKKATGPAATQIRAAADPAAELVEAAAADRLGEHGLKLEPLRELLDRVKLQIGAEVSPAAALFTAALNIQKEINRLGGGEDPEAEDLAVAAEELRRCREHLEPLELGPPDLPVSELVRLAVCKLAS